MFDIFFCLLALFILMPAFFIVCIVLKVSGEGEIFYFQERVGQDQNLFKIWKFATMLKNSPNMGTGTITLKDDARVLPFGKILRLTKFNELPQLINVLRGDMSIIGPRPHAARDLEGIPEILKHKFLQAKPGLSGLGSIIFRSEDIILSKVADARLFYDGEIAPYKASLDIWYQENQNLKLYFTLIFYTIRVVLTKDTKFIFDTLPGIPKPNMKLGKFISA
ncbi:sugar transferase [Amylibacter sp.]|nr:sugar transferase [Amylibacter sp.]